MQEAKWDIDISILTNSIVMREVIYVFGFAFGLLAALLVGLTIHDYGIEALFAMRIDGDIKYPLILIGIWLALTAVFIMVFWGNKYPLTYTVNARGVFLETRAKQVKKNQKVGCLLILLGVLTGQVRPVGIGLLATGNQNMAMNWKEVRKVKLYPRRRTIMLKGVYGVRMIVFCDQGNYAPVKALVQHYVSS